MSVEEIAVFLLNGDTETALDGRVYVEQIPQGVTAYPQILINLVTNQPNKIQSGDGVDSEELMISVLAEEYSVATALIKEVRRVLDNNSGGVYGSTTLLGVTLQNGGVNPESDQGRIFSKSLDFQFLIQK